LHQLLLAKALEVFVSKKTCAKVIMCGGGERAMISQLGSIIAALFCQRVQHQNPARFERSCSVQCELLVFSTNTEVFRFA
jgi:hypothetical protein